MALLDDCFLHDKDRMKHGEAIKLLRSRMDVIASTEIVHLREATNRILATDIIAPRNIPAFDNTAVDGYAFAFADHDTTGGFFPLSARIAAGDTDEIELPGFSAARIFTGAKMPQGADTIAMQEDCEIHEQDGTKFVVIPAGLKLGANCRKAGEDVATDETIAKAGQTLRPQDIAAIASTGFAEIEVYKPLRIGLLSSGNEILRPGQSFEQGKVYDANHFMLQGLLETGPVEISDLGVCPDEKASVQSLLVDAAQSHDVIISTGGASRGEEDYFVEALDELGKCHLWQLAVKPGRPMSFGQIDNTVCFTLPGNPVAAFVCFLLYVKPSINVLGGGEWIEPKRYAIPANFMIKSKPDRREFLRGFLEEDNDKQVAQKYDRDGSGLISGLRAASGLIEIPEDCISVSQGEFVYFIPFSEFGILNS